MFTNRKINKKNIASLHSGRYLTFIPNCATIQLEHNLDAKLFFAMEWQKGHVTISSFGLILVRLMLHILILSIKEK